MADIAIFTGILRAWGADQIDTLQRRRTTAQHQFQQPGVIHSPISRRAVDFGAFVMINAPWTFQRSASRIGLISSGG